MKINVENIFLNEFKYLYAILREIQKSNWLKYRWMIISGSRKAGKTYALINFLLLMSMMLSHNDKKSAIIIVRHQSNQLKDTWKQFNHQKQQLLLDPYFGQNQTDRVQWTLNGKVDIFFRSVYNPGGEMAVKGLPRLNYDKVFVLFDESDQMKQNEIDAMLEAVEAQIVVPIWLFNPNSNDEYIVGRANKLCPENEEIMINGSGSHFEEVYNEVGQLGIIHRVNYKINTHLSQDEIDRFKLSAKTNPKRARTAVYGLTGNAGDRSYMDFEEKRNVIKEENTKEFLESTIPRASHYVVGVDFGTTIGHSTAAVLDVYYDEAKKGFTAEEWGWENDSGDGVPFFQIKELFAEEHKCTIDNIYKYHNAKFEEYLQRLIKQGVNIYKDNERLAKELLDKVEEWTKIYPNMKRIGLKFRVDPGGGGKSFKMEIMKEVGKRRYSDWIKIKDAEKEKVAFRQQFANDLFAANWKILERCKNLIWEIRMAKNDEDKKAKGEIVREKRNDNYLDPWDYCKEGKYKRLTKGATTTSGNSIGIYHNG